LFTKRLTPIGEAGEAKSLYFLCHLGGKREKEYIYKRVFGLFFSPASPTAPNSLILLPLTAVKGLVKLVKAGCGYGAV
jgi:hypothetical protein